jgi:hypothetical protein
MDSRRITRQSFAAHGRESAPHERAFLGLAATALRTVGLLVLVTLAILVLLPAMIAAQPTFLG